MSAHYRGFIDGHRRHCIHQSGAVPEATPCPCDDYKRAVEEARTEAANDDSARFWEAAYLAALAGGRGVAMASAMADRSHAEYRHRVMP